MGYYYDNISGSIAQNAQLGVKGAEKEMRVGENSEETFERRERSLSMKKNEISSGNGGNLFEEDRLKCVLRIAPNTNVAVGFSRHLLASFFSAFAVFARDERGKNDNFSQSFSAFLFRGYGWQRFVA